jgi:hypothetical protein
VIVVRAAGWFLVLFVFAVGATVIGSALGGMV